MKYHEVKYQGVLWRYSSVGVGGGEIYSICPHCKTRLKVIQQFDHVMLEPYCCSTRYYCQNDYCRMFEHTIIGFDFDHYASAREYARLSIEDSLA